MCEVRDYLIDGYEIQIGHVHPLIRVRESAVGVKFQVYFGRNKTFVLLSFVMSLSFVVVKIKHHG